MNEKRIAKTYYFDKDLFKKAAHQSIDDECDVAAILEIAINELYDKFMNGLTDIKEFESTNKYSKSIRLYPKYVTMLEEMSKKTGITYGNILNIAIVSHYE